MHVGQVRHVDEIAYASAAGGIVIVAIDVHLLAGADGNFCGDLDQMGSGRLTFTAASLRVRAGNIEIMERCDVRTVGTCSIPQRPFDD
jgi:hypothetical protein